MPSCQERVLQLLGLFHFRRKGVISPLNKQIREVRLQNMTVAKVPSLIEILAKIADKRNKKGKRHPLIGMLALATVAVRGLILKQ